MPKKGISIERVNVDYDKLTNLLCKRGVTLQEASIALGHADTYINSLKSLKSPFKKAYLQLLEIHFNIKPEDIVIVDEPVATTEPEVNITQSAFLSEENLYKIIYTATYNAMKQALSE